MLEVVDDRCDAGVHQRRAEGANVVLVRAAVRARSRNERLCLTVVAIKVSGCRLVLVISVAV